MPLCGAGGSSGPTAGPSRDRPRLLERGRSCGAARVPVGPGSGLPGRWSPPGSTCSGRRDPPSVVWVAREPRSPRPCRSSRLSTSSSPGDAKGSSHFRSSWRSSMDRAGDRWRERSATVARGSGSMGALRRWAPRGLEDRMAPSSLRLGVGPTHGHVGRRGLEFFRGRLDLLTIPGLLLQPPHPPE